MKCKLIKVFVLLLSFVVLVGCVGNGNTDSTGDKIAPHVMINNPTTAKVGQEILIDYVVSDNVTPLDKLIVDLFVVKDNQMVNVVDNKFIAEEGVYTIKVSAKDEAGNLGSMTIDITVSGSSNPVGDTVKPTVFINTPDEACIGEKVLVDYSVEDNMSFVSEIDVEITVKKNGNEISLTDNQFVVEDAEYEIIVKATDKAGNISIMTKALYAKADDVSPVIEISQMGPIYVGEDVTVSYSASDNITKAEDLQVEMILTRGDKVRSVSDRFKVVSEGEYELTINVTDEEGNSSTQAISFVVEKGREDRKLSTNPDIPANITTTELFVNANPENVLEDGNDYLMKSDKYNVVFVKTAQGYYVDFVDPSLGKVMFTMPAPIIIYFRDSKQFTALYSSVEITDFGILASGTVTSSNGSKVLVNDYYYYPDNDYVTSAINVQREMVVLEGNKNDIGFQNTFAILTVDNKPNNIDWFIPNNIFGSFDTANQKYRIYRETLTGLPMVMFRDKTTGYSISISRYKPVIDYSTNSFACVGAFYGENTVNNNASSIEITYPTRDTARRYFDITKTDRIVYDLSIIANKTNSFDEAYVQCYNDQYMLEDVRIVNTDIDECYNVVNTDFKKLLRTNTRNGMTSYGLPWRVTIENGLIGPMSYQAGFVGQQIPCAYNMMLYGVKNNDNTSLQNGINVINFWIHSAKMMSDAGVPKVWFDGGSNRWAGYPTFTRMAVDAMEGLFDAYRLAVANGIKVDGWIEAVTACAEWLVRAQNSDGSWYRFYNYQGTYYKGTESDISWNPGNICKSTSKNNSTMPVRFLGKMYEFTGDVKYLNAIKKAGDFIYKELYPQNAYYGGTCDNPDCMDKEAGVYAMYAYDTLYTLTGDEKWIKCLEQATVFTMSSAITVSFKINKNASTLKAASSLLYGYSDGLSYIICGGTGVDNYAAYIYYQLFRLYVHTGKEVYYKMSEFIQQNTKSSMDWDGALKYPYKSLTPEASTIYAFGYSSAVDDNGVEGVWLPWQSAANAEPIAKMYDTFGTADVKTVKNSKSLAELRSILANYGVGGKAHKTF